MENTLLEILEELRAIRIQIVPQPLPNSAELERDITVALGTGPEGTFNR